MLITLAIETSVKIPQEHMWEHCLFDTDLLLYLQSVTLMLIGKEVGQSLNEDGNPKVCFILL